MAGRSEARPYNLDLKSTALFGESKTLGGDRLPAPCTVRDPDQRKIWGDAMDRPETEVLNCAVPIGGGMAGCTTNIRRPFAVGKGGGIGAAMPSVLEHFPLRGIGTGPHPHPATHGSIIGVAGWGCGPVMPIERKALWP